MEHEARLARVLWLLLVVTLGGYVVSDLVHPAIFDQRGAAAVRPTEVTLWVPPAEAGDETAAIARAAAGALELQGHATAVKSLSGGTSEAVTKFLSRPAHHGDLLVLTSSTLAGIAHDRQDRLVPGAAEQALLADELLRRSSPIAVLASERLALAVAPGSVQAGAGGLVSALRNEPAQQLFAVGDDSWSRVELANLVSQARVKGNVRFSVFDTAAEAGSAVSSGAATAFLAPHGFLLQEVRDGGLRELGWPLGDRRAPRFWVALVAAPGLPAARVSRLRRWIEQVSQDPKWRAQLKSSGGGLDSPGGRRLRDWLERGLTAAGRLELLSRQIEEG